MKLNDDNEDLIEKYATFLDSVEYLHAVHSNHVGDMYEFWKIIAVGIIKKITMV